MCASVRLASKPPAEGPTPFRFMPMDCARTAATIASDLNGQAANMDIELAEQVGVCLRCVLRAAGMRVCCTVATIASDLNGRALNLYIELAAQVCACVAQILGCMRAGGMFCSACATGCWGHGSSPGGDQGAQGLEEAVGLTPYITPIGSCPITAHQTGRAQLCLPGPLSRAARSSRPSPACCAGLPRLPCTLLRLPRHTPSSRQPLTLLR